MSVYGNRMIKSEKLVVPTPENCSRCPFAYKGRPYCSMSLDKCFFPMSIKKHVKEGAKRPEFCPRKDV